VAVSAPAAPAPELTPAQREMDSRDWTFGGTWPFEPRWLFTDGVRLHYVDEGPRDGEPVVLLHGNPTWGYLYRRFIPALAEAGYRAIAHDELGFGRSDKPKRRREYTIQRHAKQFGALMDELALRDVTLVLQDWGGPIGLAWAVDNPDRVKRLVILNTFTGSVPDGLEPPFVFRLLRAPAIGELLVKGAHVFVRRLLFREGLAHPERLGEDERAAYLAPHPSWDSRTGVLAYPRLIPWDRDNPTRPLAEHVEAGLHLLAEKPVLVCWAMQDPAFRPPVLAMWRRRFPAAEVHELDDASHFLQEDAHERIVPLLLAFLRRTSS
jgi:pimeloyl-ACP methyl ester carboxylesterase